MKPYAGSFQPSLSQCASYCGGAVFCVPKSEFPTHFHGQNLTFSPATPQPCTNSALPGVYEVSDFDDPASHPPWAGGSSPTVRQPRTNSVENGAPAASALTRRLGVREAAAAVSLAPTSAHDCDACVCCTSEIAPSLHSSARLLAQ